MQQIQLVITQLPNGTVQVNGPVYDKMLCYALLELAKDAVREAPPPPEAPKLHIAHGFNGNA